MLACSLRQHGISVRVIDQAPGPAVTSRALILHARGVETLDRLGALGDLPDRAISAVKTTFHLDGRPLLTIRFGQVEGSASSALVISQAEIESELRERRTQLGVAVEWGTQLVGATEDGDGIIGETKDGSSIRAR
jgi:4,5-epoxidase